GSGLQCLGAGGIAEERQAIPDNRIVAKVQACSHFAMRRRRKLDWLETTAPRPVGYRINPCRDRERPVRPSRHRADATYAKFELCPRGPQASREGGGTPAALHPDRPRVKQRLCRRSISSFHRA